MSAGQGFIGGWQMRLLPLLWGTGRIWEPSDAQRRAFAAFTQVGDPTADALVASIKGPHGQQVRRQFEAALSAGIDSVPDVSPELGAFFREAEAVPFWLDRRKVEIGSELLQGIGPLVAPILMVGLSVTYTTKDGNDVLLRSGDTRDKAGKRATETLAWVSQVTAPGGLEHGAPGYAASLRVRLTHAFMRSGMARRADWDNPHLPVNQQVFSNVIIAFSVIPMIASLFTGRYFTRRERDAIFHLWRYVAYLIGVDDGLMAAGEDDMVRLMMLFFQDVIDPDDNATLLGSALIDAYPEIYGITGTSSRDAAARWLILNAHAALSRVAFGGEISDWLGYPKVSPVAVPLFAAGVAANAVLNLPAVLPPVRRARARVMGRVSARLLAQLMDNVGGNVERTFERKQADNTESVPIGRG